MKQTETIAAAGNTEVPCYLAVQALGFEVTREHGGTPDETWIAEKPGSRFVASSLPELLGLISMREIRGSQWKASDEEIEGYLARYCPESLEG